MSCAHISTVRAVGTVSGFEARRPRRAGPKARSGTLARRPRFTWSKGSSIVSSNSRGTPWGLITLRGSGRTGDTNPGGDLRHPSGSTGGVMSCLNSSDPQAARPCGRGIRYRVLRGLTSSSFLVFVCGVGVSGEACEVVGCCLGVACDGVECFGVLVEDVEPVR